MHAQVDPALLAFLRDEAPDVLCLQELKCEDHVFPRGEIEDAGYNLVVHGQKTFNGVAILSKLPFDEVTPRLPGDAEDDHARFIEAQVSTDGGVVRVASIYLPNGNPPETDKYKYKLRWIDRLIKYTNERLKLEEPLVLAGDYNVIPTPLDAKHPENWTGDALFQPESRAKFRSLVNLGFTDATITEQKLDDGGLYFEVQCAESNRLIGRHGQTLGDLQYLANRIAFNHDDSAYDHHCSSIYYN